MKTVFAFAAFVCLCACAAGDPILLVPHPLPCEFILSVETNITSDDQGIFNESRTVKTIFSHGEYVKVIDETVYPKSYASVLLARVDIRNPENQYVAVAEINTLDNNNCSQKFADRFAVNDTYTEDIAEFTTESMFDNATKGTFEGKECKVYFRTLGSVAEYYFVNNDGYIIGIMKYSDNCNTTARVSYGFQAPLDLFVIDEEKNPGCLKSMSVVPKLDTCKDNVFKPNPIPCACSVSASVADFSPNGTQITQAYNTFYFRDTIEKIVVNQTLPVSAEMVLLMRTDIYDKTTDTVAFYQILPANTSYCDEQMLSRSQIINTLRSYTGPLFNSFDFEAMIEGEYEKEKATYYYQFTKVTEPLESEVTAQYIVNKDGRIVHIAATTKVNTRKISLAYENNAPLDLFVMPKSEGCSAKAYNPPTEDPCVKRPSSSDGFISRPSLVVAVIFVMCALLF